MKKVTRTLTLSKYRYGMHHFNKNADGRPSFAESLTPLDFMIEELYKSGIELGTSVRITMEALEPSKQSQKRTRK